MTAAPGPSISTRPSSALGVALLFVLLVAGVARLQPRLASTTAAIKAREDVYLFPPPAELRVATLGYLAAATDILWAKLLVEYGVHWAEHRPFPDLNRYLDSLIALDPKNKTLYEFIDTLLVYRPVHGTEEDARAARAYLERGIAELPYDPDVWLHYAQFVAFMGPSFLASDAEREKWKEEGAFALAHAAELGADVDRSIVASTMLNRRFGERDASIRFLERAYALANDETSRAEISAKLELLQASREQDQAQDAIQSFERQWRRDFPFLSRGEYLLLGPLIDPAVCAGPVSEGARGCPSSWDEAISPR
jgi:hypothetical protein